MAIHFLKCYPTRRVQEGVELRKKISQQKDWALIAAEALSLFPQEDTGSREVRWEGSEAERLLRIDMDARKHETMAPVCSTKKGLNTKSFLFLFFGVTSIKNNEDANFVSSTAPVQKKKSA
jgi:hypothetical protein